MVVGGTVPTGAVVVGTFPGTFVGGGTGIRVPGTPGTAVPFDGTLVGAIDDAGACVTFGLTGEGTEVFVKLGLKVREELVGLGVAPGLSDGGLSKLGLAVDGAVVIGFSKLGLAV